MLCQQKLSAVLAVCLAIVSVLGVSTEEGLPSVTKATTLLHTKSTGTKTEESVDTKSEGTKTEESVDTKSRKPDEVEAAAAVAAVTSSAVVVEPPKEDAVTSETKESMDKAVGREKLDSKSKCTCSRILRINYLRKID